MNSWTILGVEQILPEAAENPVLDFGGGHGAGTLLPGAGAAVAVLGDDDELVAADTTLHRAAEQALRPPVLVGCLVRCRGETILHALPDIRIDDRKLGDVSLDPLASILCSRAPVLRQAAPQLPASDDEAGGARRADGPQSSKSRDIVLDPFGGSGTTLIACEKGGRAARLVELDPKYCDVIVRRWQELTGQAAVLEGDGRTFEEVAAGSRTAA